MDDENNREYSTPEGDEYTLPIPDIASSEAMVGPVESPITANFQQRVGSALHDEAREEHLAQNRKPLLVRVIEDDELSSFERKTVKVALWGFGLAVISLIATVGAGVVFYRQFTEMAKQTKILTASFEKQKLDSTAAAAVTAQQLALAQQQIDTIQEQTRVDQRAWISLRGRRSTPMEVGKPLAGELEIRNTGKTPATHIEWRFVIELVPNGAAPRLFTFIQNGDQQPQFSNSYKGKMQFVAGYQAIINPNSPEIVDKIDVIRGSTTSGQMLLTLLTADEVTAYEGGKAYIAHGAVRYQDIYKRWHWIQLCIPNVDPRVQGSFTYGGCISDNGIDGER